MQKRMQEALFQVLTSPKNGAMVVVCYCCCYCRRRCVFFGCFPPASLGSGASVPASFAVPGAAFVRDPGVCRSHARQRVPHPAATRPQRFPTLEALSSVCCVSQSPSSPRWLPSKMVVNRLRALAFRPGLAPRPCGPEAPPSFFRSWGNITFSTFSLLLELRHRRLSPRQEPFAESEVDFGLAGGRRPPFPGEHHVAGVWVWPGPSSGGGPSGS